MNEVLVAELGAALSPDRVRIGGTELALYQRDASNLEGQAGVVCFPTSTDEVQACVRIAGPSRPAVRRPWRRYRAGRRGDSARRRDHDRHHQDEPGAVGRSGQPAGVGRARRAEPRPHEGRHAVRIAFRPRPQQPAELFDRRQRCQQLRWSTLPVRRCHDRTHPRSRSRAARR